MHKEPLTSEMRRLEQFKLVYDYIKFHLGLYLATPPVFAVVAESFQVQNSRSFQWGLGLMIVIYLISGIHASFFMGKHINTRWSDNRFLNSFDSEAYTRFRRSMHHTLYWFGLLVGLGGLGWAIWGERIMKLLRFACECGLPVV